MEPERGWITAGGKRLECARWQGRAPSLVLLHEGLGCVELWRGFPAALAQATGCSVFAYSRAGYGRSQGAELPRPLDYMTREAEVLAQILTDIPDPLLIGHSDGATIAAIHGGRGTRGMVLMAPHFFAEDISIAEITRAGQAFADTDMATRMARFHDDPAATFAGWHDAWTHPDFRTWTIEHEVSRISVPVLAIQGNDDQYGTLAQIDAICGPLEAKRLILPDCRHSPHLDQPGQVLGAIAEFVGLVAFGEGG